MKKHAYQILPTKLNRPRLRSNLIIRSNLISQLNDGLNKRLILVSAPAGFGKSTLINSWLADQNLPATWLSLDKADNDPSRFFAYFFSALSKVLPEIDLNCFGDFNFSNRPTSENILISLINKLDETPTGFIFVLDDYHVIKNPIIHDAVQFLLENLIFNGQPGVEKKGILPIIVSRSDPPFPLSKWRIQGELTEIRSSDLRFSETDCKSFLHQATGIPISDKQAKDLITQTEGWVAGLQLAAISFNEQRLDNLDQFIQGFGGGNHLVSDYLVNEVISLLPEKLQLFLINTSILERMSGPLCDEILQTNDSQDILESLEKSNLFIIPLDDQRIWFRYHHLLSEYLSKRQVQMAKELFIKMHLNAAVWFERNRYLDESIQHLLAIGKLDYAVRIITKNASPILNQGKTYYLAELLAYFPPEAFNHWPWLCIYRGWKDAILGTGEEEYWVSKAEQIINENYGSNSINPEEIDEMLGNISAIRAMSAAKNGDIATTFKVAPLALALLPSNTNKVRGLVLHAEGRCQYLDGQLDDAQNTLFRAKNELKHGGNIGGAAESLGLAGEISFTQGKLHKAETTFKEALALNNNPEAEFCAAYQSYCGLGEVYYEWNRVPLAFDFLERGFSESSKLGISARVCTGTALANTYLNLGEMEKAEAILEELDTPPSKQTLQPPIESKLSACWIRLYSYTARFRQAQRLIEERRISRIDVSDFIREPEKIALIQFYLLMDDPKTGLALAMQLSESLRSSNRIGRLIKIYLLQSLTHIELGETESASNSLQLALNAGRLEGYLRSFIDSGNPIFQLLIELSHMDPKQMDPSFDLTYIREIIDASLKRNTPFQNQPQNKTIRKSLHLPILDTPLTPPEISILQLVVAGYDNFEIASNQQISINTVKTHIAHIFGKLGVHNRVQAANRAKILGLV
jgi:LuxR family transcriptional regulator, maltose regulon positive regulatory protein